MDNNSDLPEADFFKKLLAGLRRGLRSEKINKRRTEAN